MRLCPSKEIEDGMVLGKSIYDADGRLLLSAGYRLLRGIKSRLSSRGYNHIYIHEEGTVGVIPQDIISDQIRLQAISGLADKAENIRKIIQFEDMIHDKAIKLIENGHLKKVNISSDLKKIVEEIMKDISAAGAKFMDTIMFKSKDTYYMDHAINTTVLAIMIAQKYGLNKQEIASLALGTFLHDIGKVITEQINDNDNSKKATDYYKEHSTFGYLLLRDNANISPMESQVVNQHHEYQNGSGFPIGLSGQNLPPVNIKNRETKGRIFRLAEICCVANAYDKMVLNPNGENHFAPHEVMKKMIVDSEKIYNKDIVKTLIQIVPAFPIGAYIRVINISNPALVDYAGVVAKINENNLHKPVIILTRDKFMKKIKPEIIDTSELSNVKLKLIL